MGEYTLDKPPIVEFGYLTVAVDMTGRDHHLTIEFHDRTNTHIHDTTHLNLRTGPPHSTCSITQKSRARLLFVT